jgi:mitogen-activated protein kinase kinase kinase
VRDGSKHFPEQQPEHSDPIQRSKFTRSMDQALSWLATNQFSNDWQETFKALNIYGSVFLDISTYYRSNHGVIHHQLYPHLAAECSKSGTGWNQAREPEEGRRFRHLVNSIVVGRAPD